jgi:hypothetical protein
MTTTAPRPSVTETPQGLSNASVARKGNVFVDWLTTTDHKKDWVSLPHYVVALLPASVV